MSSTVIPSYEYCQLSNDNVAKYTHGHSSGTNINDINNHFLIWSKIHFNRRKCMPGTINLAKNPGPRADPTINILLSGHCIKLPFKYASLSPQISSTVPGPHQKFLCGVDSSLWRNSRLAKVQTMCFWRFKSHWDISITPLLPRPPDYWGRTSGKTAGAPGGKRPGNTSVFWTWQDHYTVHELRAAVVICTRPSQSIFQHGRRQGLTSAHLYSRNFLQLGKWEEGESVFLKGPGSSTILL